jgi:hypothetical protein
MTKRAEAAAEADAVLAAAAVRRLVRNRIA